ncbi:MAG: TIGR03118 family protein [Alphaproteobacteria bacterium]|nr:TIGR03118 family protein [Alphaproteobacteria bacterium]
MLNRNSPAAIALLVGFSLTAHAAEHSETPHFVAETFTANKTNYAPRWLENDFVNGWGIAIRPAGAGGHFWITAKDVSYEYVGDVRQSPEALLRSMHTDALKYVKLPVGGGDKFATGVVFSDSTEHFVISQTVPDTEQITAPAKFLFASDGGIVSAWTERKKTDGSFDRSGEALKVIDQSAIGAQFFGLALNAAYDRLYVADFGAAPAIKVFDGKFQPLPLAFDQPFDTNKNGKVDAGEYAPFNIQLLPVNEGETDAARKPHLFVTYAKTQKCPKAAQAEKVCAKNALWPGEEDTSEPGSGRVAEFTEDGKLVAVWPDAGKLSAPWGVVFAPASWGKLGGALIVGNFGDGTISAYDGATRQFIDVLRDGKGKPVIIDKIWGILFGNGESLGDKDALYFAAGPDDEKDGVFGVLRPLTAAKVD